MCFSALNDKIALFLEDERGDTNQPTNKEIGIGATKEEDERSLSILHTLSTFLNQKEFFFFFFSCLVFF